MSGGHRTPRFVFDFILSFTTAHAPTARFHPSWTYPFDPYHSSSYAQFINYKKLGFRVANSDIKKWQSLLDFRMFFFHFFFTHENASSAHCLLTTLCIKITVKMFSYISILFMVATLFTHMNFFM